MRKGNPFLMALGGFAIGAVLTLMLTGFSTPAPTQDKPFEEVELVICTDWDVRTETELAPTETEPVPTETASTPTEPEPVYFDVPLSEDLQDHIFEVCEDYDIDPAIIIAIIDRESDFRDWLKGDGGESYGLMQVKYKYHADRMYSLGYADLMDPYANTHTGISYLASLIDYGYGIEWALMAYNGGPGYARSMHESGTISAYASGVLEHAEQLNMERETNYG